MRFGATAVSCMVIVLCTQVCVTDRITGVTHSHCYKRSSYRLQHRMLLYTSSQKSSHQFSKL